MAEQGDQEEIAIKRISRRRLLAGLGAGAAGLLVAASCGGGRSEDKSATGETSPGPTADPSDILAPGLPTLSLDQNCGTQDDPMNLVFSESNAGTALARDVYAGLHDGDGWTTPHLALNQWPVELPGVDEYLCASAETTHRQNEQAAKQIDWRSRHHVRIWNYTYAGSASVGSAHAEVLSLKFAWDFYPQHVVTSFEDGERRVADVLEQQGWHKQSDSIPTGSTSSPMDDGRATKLTR